MLTKKQVQEIKPAPFEVQLSFTRFNDGQIVPQTHAAYSPPRIKREWDNVTKSYVPKMRRAV